MITINLKPGTRRAKAGASLAGGLSSLKGLTDKVKDPWPMAAAAAWIALVVFVAWTGLGAASGLRSLAPELDKARSENRRYHAFLGEKKHAEAARDSVLIQIATISQVDGDRYVWPHILDEVTRALPDYTWLTDLTAVGPSAAAAAAAAAVDTVVSGAPPVTVQMVGRTMDIQGFTRFMRQLEDSPWLKDVTVLSTETIIERGRAVTSFTLRASYERSRPAHTQAAPATGAGGT
jgi:Tfp pilus assembly protein PilN